VVAAFLAAAGHSRPGTWNIGTGAEVSVLQLATMIGDVAGHGADPKFAPMRAGELQRSAIAVERAKRDLGWSARMQLADGVRAVYEWIEAGASDRAGY
jgi:UDP-glucose 4-epimerase